MSHVTSLAAGVMLAAAVSSIALAKTEKEFVNDAIMGDNSEVALGQLAAANAVSDSAKAFGQTLVTDHSQHRAQAAAVAQKLGLTPPSDTSAEAQEEMAKLKTLSGKAFDQEFAAFMVRDHEKDISEFKTEASSGRGPAQQLASQSLPTLEKHLRMAQELERGR